VTAEVGAFEPFILKKRQHLAWPAAKLSTGTSEPYNGGEGLSKRYTLDEQKSRDIALVPR